VGLVVAGSVLPMERGKLVWGCHGRGLLYKEGDDHHLVTNREARRAETVKVALGM